ncbi:MAG: ribbon-helix-helix protein, CopG family [Solirubrobacteraceae bacterium]
MAARNWTIRLNEHDDDRLERLAEARGVSRAALVRTLIRDADLEAGGGLPAVADREELLAVLSERARGGHVQAARSLLDELRRDGEPAAEDDDPFRELDMLAPRRDSRRPPAA